jgi:hypothetical protein
VHASPDERGGEIESKSQTETSDIETPNLD